MNLVVDQLINMCPVFFNTGLFENPCKTIPVLFMIKNIAKHIIWLIVIGGTLRLFIPVFSIFGQGVFVVVILWLREPCRVTIIYLEVSLRERNTKVKVKNGVFDRWKASVKDKVRIAIDGVLDVVSAIFLNIWLILRGGNR